MNRFVLLFFFFRIACAHGASNYERFEQNGKMGIKDELGQVVLPASFDALGWSDGSFSLVGQITGYRQGAHWGLLNLKKEFITQASYQTLTSPGGDRVIVSKPLNPFTTKFGSINLKGELKIPFWYDEIRINDLRAIVMTKNGLRYEYGLVDLNNRTILPVKYKKITALGTLRYAIQDFSGKSALCSEEGKWSTSFTIDSLSTFQYGYAILYQGCLQGAIDRSGEIRLEPNYREVIVRASGIQFRKADTWKIVDLKLQDLHHIEADELVALSANRNRITLAKKSGLVDASLQPVLPIQYDYVGPVENELVVVKENGKYGLLKTNKAVVLPIVFDSLILNGHLIRTLKKTGGQIQWDLFDTVGVRKTKTSYEWIGSYNGKLFPAKKHGFMGAINLVGQEQIACVYDSLLEINEDYVAVKFHGQFGIITQDDRWKLSPQEKRIRLLPAEVYIERQDSLHMMKDFYGNIVYFTNHPIGIFQEYLLERLPDGTEKKINFLGQIATYETTSRLPQGSEAFRERESLTVIKRDGKYGFVDGLGRLRIANRYEGAGAFSEGLAPVRLLGKWGFIDNTDNIVVQPILDKMSAFHKGVAIVQRNGKMGLINREGTVLLELRYDSIRKLGDETFIVSQESLKGLADAQGRILIEPRFEILQKAGPNHVIVKQNDKFGLLTLDGYSVFPLRYDQLTYLPGSGLFFTQESHAWESKVMK